MTTTLSLTGKNNIAVLNLTGKSAYCKGKTTPYYVIKFKKYIFDSFITPIMSKQWKILRQNSFNLSNSIKKLQNYYKITNDDSLLLYENMLLIIKNAIEIKLKKRKYMVLGNLYAKRDWGYSKDYVEAMWLMLQQKKPDDYVISTEKNFSIKQFVIFTFKYLGINIIWRGKGLNEKGINKENNRVIIKISKNYFRPAEVDFLKGSSKKARQILHWKPKTSIYKLVKIMIDDELKNHL